MIPPIDPSTGYLPFRGLGQSTYPATIDEVRDQFAFNDIRKRRLERFAAWVEDLDSLQFPGKLWVSGSFVSLKPDPSDVDVVVVTDDQDKFVAKSILRASHPMWTWLNVKAEKPRAVTLPRMQPFGGTVDAHWTIDLPDVGPGWETWWTTEYDDLGEPTGVRKGFLEVAR